MLSSSHALNTSIVVMIGLIALPWDFQETSMIFLWRFCEASMTLVEDFLNSHNNLVGGSFLCLVLTKVPREVPWESHGIRVPVLWWWQSHGYLVEMEVLWNSHHNKRLPWNFREASVGLAWDCHGVFSNSHGSVAEVRKKSHMYVAVHWTSMEVWCKWDDVGRPMNV